MPVYRTACSVPLVEEPVIVLQFEPVSQEGCIAEIVSQVPMEGYWITFTAMSINRCRNSLVFKEWLKTEFASRTTRAFVF